MSAIFYFSGTGNSRYIAETLARHTGDTVGDMARDYAEGVTLPDEGRIGWVFPVYAWGVPRVVEDFIRSFPVCDKSADYFVYAVLTCGDDIGRTDRQLQSLLRTKGLPLHSVYSLQMPNTYVCLPGFDVDPQPLAASKLTASEQEVRKIADEIVRSERGVRRIHPGRFPDLKSGLIRWLFNRFLLSDRYFHALPSCIGCRQCSRQCPTRNITHGPHARPHWNRNCTGCLSCYHHCPVGAVQFGSFTRGKGRYLCPRVK